ncbi:hypothetical protein CLAIMM_15216 [Cladophialophora immunda]|nr:hypothetical protein CLAIMM_15216 [Cladophialophora immunda]
MPKVVKTPKKPSASSKNKPTPSPSPSPAAKVTPTMPPPNISNTLKAKAKEWRENGYGRVQRPLLTSKSTVKDKLEARFWRGKNDLAVKTKCWSCFKGNKVIPSVVGEAPDGTEDDPCLACGCLASYALVEELLVVFDIYPSDPKEKKNKNKDFALAPGQHRFNFLELIKMFTVKADAADD